MRIRVEHARLTPATTRAPSDMQTGSVSSRARTAGTNGSAKADTRRRRGRGRERSSREKSLHLEQGAQQGLLPHHCSANPRSLVPHVPCRASAMPSPCPPGPNLRCCILLPPVREQRSPYKGPRGSTRIGSAAANTTFICPTCLHGTAPLLPTAQPAERVRRQRLADAFKDLNAMLPPALERDGLSKVAILTRAQHYIKCVPVATPAHASGGHKVFGSGEAQ